jgi:hypothetical protein
VKDTYIHVLPIDGTDALDHDVDTDCPCKPVAESQEVGGVKVVVVTHHGYKVDDDEDVWEMRTVEL